MSLTISASDLSTLAKLSFRSGASQTRLSRAFQVSQQHHPIARKLVQIDRVAAVATRDVRVSREFGLRRGELVHRPVQEPAEVQPFVKILAPIPARGAPGAANAQIDLAPTFIQLFCDLAARLSAANHQDRTRWE